MGVELDALIEKAIKVTGCPLTKEEVLKGLVEIHNRRLQCKRCGLIFGVERLNWTGMYYHPRWECDARLKEKV